MTQEESTRESKFRKILDEKGKEKNFPDNYMMDIYKVESQFLNQFTRNEAQKKNTSTNSFHNTRRRKRTKKDQ